MGTLLGSPTFTWKGADVPCVPSALRRGTTLALGGFEVDVLLTLFVLKSNFFETDPTLQVVDSLVFSLAEGTPKPVAGKTVVYAGKTYRILSAREVSTQAHIELELGDPNR
jgi:hypothetical protein